MGKSVGKSAFRYGAIVPETENALTTETLTAAMIAEALKVRLVEEVGVHTLLRGCNCYILPLKLLGNVFGVHITVHIRLPRRCYVPANPSNLSVYPYVTDASLEPRQRGRRGVSLRLSMLPNSIFCTLYAFKTEGRRCCPKLWDRISNSTSSDKNT